MARMRKKSEEKIGISITPMIDCVFLLLMYFMVSSTLGKQEADLSFQLPGTVEQSEPLEMPDEQIIEIDPQGQVIVNDYRYDRPDSPRFVELASMLSRFREACDANKVEARITIAPSDQTPHQSIVKVMDACAFGRIKSVHFALGEES